MKGATCTGTWTSLVRHQCDKRAGHPDQHHCPCGAFSPDPALSKT